MKHVRTHFPNDSGWPSAPSPEWYQSALSWSEELRTENAKSQIYSRSENFSAFLEPAVYDTLQQHDVQSGAIKIAFYDILQALSQSSIISSHLAYTLSLAPLKLDSEPETDIWVDMPPRSTRRVEMQAQYAGRGKSLPFD
ncbi:MAG: hypothetical protein M3Y39_00175 [Chloroflexota bacterium]|nr:hypothetical protein [Chloroflexota bacterium]